MHDCALVDTTTGEIYKDRNHGYYAEDPTRPERLSLLVNAAACKGRAALEEVCAVVYGSDERNRRLGQRVVVTEKGDYGSLATLALFGFLLVVVVVIALDDLSGVEGGGLERSLGFQHRTEGATSIVENEFSTAEYRLGTLEPGGNKKCQRCTSEVCFCLVRIIRPPLRSASLLLETHPIAHCLFPIS